MEFQVTWVDMAKMLSLVMFLIVWEAVWKGIGLWKAGRHRQLGWFIAMFILNTAGLLPIIYLSFFQRKHGKGSKYRKMRRSP